MFCFCFFALQKPFFHTEWLPSVTDASPSLVSSGGGAGVCLSCISVGADEKSREDQSETSALLYATFNSFIYVLVFGFFLFSS